MGTRRWTINRIFPAIVMLVPFLLMAGCSEDSQDSGTLPGGGGGSTLDFTGYYSGTAEIYLNGSYHKTISQEIRVGPGYGNCGGEYHLGFVNLHIHQLASSYGAGIDESSGRFDGGCQYSNMDVSVGNGRADGSSISFSETIQWKQNTEEFRIGDYADISYSGTWERPD